MPLNISPGSTTTLCCLQQNKKRHFNKNKHPTTAINNPFSGTIRTVLFLCVCFFSFFCGLLVFVCFSFFNACSFRQAKCINRQSKTLTGLNWTLWQWWLTHQQSINVVCKTTNKKHMKAKYSPIFHPGSWLINTAINTLFLLIGGAKTLCAIKILHCLALLCPWAFVNYSIGFTLI